MKQHLDICIQIEETLGQAYRNMAQSPKVSRRVRKALQNLADDEFEHASQLSAAQRFPELTEVKNLEASKAVARNLLEQVQWVLQRTEQVPLDDQQALSISLELEKQFSLVHSANASEFIDSDIRQTFANLAKEDEKHQQQLLDLQNSQKDD